VFYIHTQNRYCTVWVASPRGFSEMTIRPARHECHACCPLQAEKPGIQPVVGNTHGSHVKQVVSTFQKILRGSQLTWYRTTFNRMFVFTVRNEFWQTEPKPIITSLNFTDFNAVTFLNRTTNLTQNRVSNPTFLARPGIFRTGSALLVSFFTYAAIIENRFG